MSDRRVVAVNGSPSHPSRSRSLAELALGLLGGGDVVDLAELDPGALLALRSDARVDAARDQVAAAEVLVVATPVYRATYTALTKTIFDLLPQGALAGTVTIPIATGYVADHRLAIDHGLRPLIASLDGWTTPTGVYATKADIADDGTVADHVRDAVAAAVAEARALAEVLSRPPG
ncbi:NAD(P)H-dependent oxidoreductase [Aquihabitans sp. G128]|uniref:NAD(P)H-dependent oxidoreductase n=1 Tax=Aquihabitans sp. G128 TaxID=2849779 RepID=UPI001C24693C|nr:NAD(P)H-dependent oxidoreductase [Aquihabitans sp. G128]QXC59384.1 NAD(P)H-dependent oxidoreductase [Aquihabitans sp. G128]